MAAGAVTLYNSALLENFKGAASTQDWDTDSHYMILLANTYTPSGAHATLADVSADEIGDVDYARQDMTGESVTGAAGTVTGDASDVTFGNPVTITAKYAVIVKGTVATSATTDALVGYIDLNSSGGDAASTNGAFTVQWSVNGLFQVTQA